MHVPTLVLCALVLIVSRAPAYAQTSGPPPPSGASEPAEPAVPESGDTRRWAIIVVGLPGDEEHAGQFEATTNAWRDWLTTQLGFARQNVIVCRGSVGDETSGTRAATRDAIAELCRTLSAQSGPDDGFWLFVLGHGDFDGTAAHVHLPGPDPDAADFAQWLAPLKCREQILWLTQCCSGYWLPRLSRPGRVVVTATMADAEVNETEFPHALASVVRRSPGEIDANSDQQVSLLELLTAVAAETERRFESDQRLPTEHAQLDDNGDARGTELKAAPLEDTATKGGEAPETERTVAESTITPQPTAAVISPDGEFSRSMNLPYQPESWQPRGSPPTPSSAPSASDSPSTEN